MARIVKRLHTVVHALIDVWKEPNFAAITAVSTGVLRKRKPHALLQKRNVW